MYPYSIHSIPLSLAPSPSPAPLSTPSPTHRYIVKIYRNLKGTKYSSQVHKNCFRILQGTMSHRPLTNTSSLKITATYCAPPLPSRPSAPSPHLSLNNCLRVRSLIYVNRISPGKILVWGKDRQSNKAFLMYISGFGLAMQSCAVRIRLLMLINT